MREHISLWELARGPEPAFQLIIDSQVDVPPFIGGTIERSRGRFGSAAPRLRVVAKQHQPRMAIGNSRLLRQHLLPCFLRIVQHEGNELYQRLFRFVARGICPVDGCGGRRSGPAAPEREKGFLEDKAQDEQDHHAAQTPVHPTKTKSSPPPPTIALLPP